MTLTRTIIRLKMLVESVSVVNGVQAVDLGIGLLEQDAFGAQVAPDPNVAADQTPRGWVYRDRLIVRDGAALRRCLSRR